MFVVSAWTGLLAVLVLRTIDTVQGETLTPPYFNLAEGRKTTATATCGVDTEGPELYCKLVGANAENDLNVNVIQGQVKTRSLVYNFTFLANFADIR
jgi:hypothetical protein